MAEVKKPIYLLLMVFLVFSLSIPSFAVEGDPTPVGYEFLDEGKVLRIWNNFDSYYFNVSSGIQFSNHYQEWWSHNVLGIGYYQDGEWHVLYWTDSLANFERNLQTDLETYINITLWKDLTYWAGTKSYDIRLAIRYHLKANDTMLTIQPYCKNIGSNNINVDLGFAWRIKDIKVSNDFPNDKFSTFWEIDENTTGGESYYLNQTLDKSYLNITVFHVIDTVISQCLDMEWSSSLIGRMKVTVKTLTGQFNAPITILVKVGTLVVGQEKTTLFFWHDADLIDSYSETNKDGDQQLKDHHPSDTTSVSASGQSFQCTGGAYKITSCKFYLRKDGSPTGNAHAVLYAHSGTFGSSSVPTGSALATSDNFDWSTVSDASFDLHTLTFSGAEQYQMTEDEYYCLAFEAPASGTVDATNFVRVGEDRSSPTHGGNLFRYLNGIWASIDTRDCCFYIYGEIAGQEYERSANQTINVGLTTSTKEEYLKSASQGVSIGLTTATLEEYLKTASQGITVGTTASTTEEYLKSATQTISLALSAIGEMSYGRTGAVTVTISSSIGRLIEVTRQATQTIGLSTVATRLIEVSVSAAQTITLALDGVGAVLEEYSRAATLTITMTLRTFADFIDSLIATKGFVLASGFLVLLIGVPLVVIVWGTKK